MAYKIPWSNFHELNLDWLLEQVKKLREDVDNITASATPSTTTPLMDGVVAIGTEDKFARGDHRHPTDTSRAAQSDLTQEITDRGNADLALASDIADVDAKIKFSAAAPIMDSSSASAGFSDYLARADHIHPTDTSRASAADVATLTARVDNIVGAASPYDVTPLMDGVGTSGTVGAYSRGDHRHPADTSKLDKAGGTITGDLEIQGNLTETKLEVSKLIDYSGWYKAASLPIVAGSMIHVVITRDETSQIQEVHSFDLIVNNTGVSFRNEFAEADAKIIDQIRVTSAGIVDLHFDQSYSSNIGVKIERYAPTAAIRDNINIGDLSLRSDTPAGETVILSVNLATSAWFMNKSDLYRVVQSYSQVMSANSYLKIDDYTGLDVPSGDYLLSMYVRGFSTLPSYGMQLMKGSDGVSIYLGVAAAGTYAFGVEYWFMKL